MYLTKGGNNRMVEDTVTSISDPLGDYWARFVDYVPQLISALVVLVLGLVVATIIANLVKRLLEYLENEQHVTNFLKKWNLNIKVAYFVGRFTWWLVFLVFLSAAVQILDIAVLTDSINALVAFLPSLFAAAVVIALTVVAARVVRELVVGTLDSVNFGASHGVGTTTYVALMVFGLTLAAAQLGVDTTLLTANITIIIAGIVLALALAFGLGGKDVAAKMLKNVYDNSNKKK